MKTLSPQEFVISVVSQSCFVQETTRGFPPFGRQSHVGVGKVGGSHVETCQLAENGLDKHDGPWQKRKVYQIAENYSS